MRLVMLFACCLLAAACGSTPPDVDPLPENPEPAGATVFSARPDIVDAHPLTITSYSRIDDNRLSLHFETGTPECFGVAPAVIETEDVVTVSLEGGTLPEAQDSMCIMVAVFGTIEVPLQSPLGDRVVTAS
ncbi:hypothetical protein HCA61_09425 [Rhodococcus sp. HNM0563]|uniref:hypothetical protein n=1 Tax=unclassified Rhodococcus (in: high G+C Gram-positive bacteria) TaxID=192944 RepID=UPI00146A13EF|nr:MULTISPECIES: hypothetical protein [unclassified Rhodococcus (in: high G+C Gram-positive bacteria)]MCK0089578.1 hypothetical protein [Rhodococcus sp. F64268]NLU62485.1 hypothetical protein [Rhodococcus sp. HNM0563]